MSIDTDRITPRSDNSSFGGMSSSSGLGSDWLSALGRMWNDVSGSSASNQFNAEQSALDRSFQSSEAEKNRKWQTEMSNTAYQRQVADMQAAGLNPYSISGSGASVGSVGTPSGSAARSSDSKSGGFVGAFARILSGAVGSAIISKAKRDISSGKAAADVASSATNSAKSADLAIQYASSRHPSASSVKSAKSAKSAKSNDLVFNPDDDYDDFMQFLKSVK